MREVPFVLARNPKLAEFHDEVLLTELYVRQVRKLEE